MKTMMTTINYPTRERSLSYSDCLDFFQSDAFLDIFDSDFGIGIEEGDANYEDVETLSSSFAETVKESDTSDSLSEYDSNPTIPFDCYLYRQEAIRKWHEKRKRRSFKKKTICKARKDIAEARPRKGGRFVKSGSSGFVAITELQSFSLDQEFTD